MVFVILIDRLREFCKKSNILNTKITDTAYIQKAIDSRMKITEKEPKTKLYNSISSLINELLNIKNEVKEF